MYYMVFQKVSLSLHEDLTSGGLQHGCCLYASKFFSSLKCFILTLCVGFASCPEAYIPLNASVLGGTAGLKLLRHFIGGGGTGPLFYTVIQTQQL